MKKKKLLVGKMKRFKALFITLVMVMFSGQIALAEAFELSGIVSGDVEEGVTITLSGNADEATVTTSGGAYSFLVDNGIYTVTPSLEMYSFVPENTEVTITGASVPQVDFVSVADEQDDDIDDDGVLNEDDECKDTPAGVIIDPSGCSIEQLVPCNGNRKNHGQYVSAFTQTVKSFMKQKLIAKDEIRALMKKAASSDCGKYVASEYTVVCDPDTPLCWQDPQREAYNYDDIGVRAFEADQYCSELILGGFEDWRVPTIAEIRSITAGFPGTETGGACPIVDGKHNLWRGPVFNELFQSG